MIDSRIKLTILADADGTFTDHSDDACDYSRDDFTVTLNADTDYLYVGFRKAIGGFYVELTEPNAYENTLGAEYYNGSAWVSLDIRDETKGFTRSGFITFDRTNLKATTVNSLAKFFVRLRPSATHSDTVVRGINLVFSDDATLKGEFPDVDNDSIIPEGHSSHIISHQAARNEIVQDLRKRGYIKSTSAGLENLDQWDLIDIFEVRQASVYKSLANIFFSLADSPNDKFYLQYAHYNDKYLQEINGIRISVDEDDDGQANSAEKLDKARSTRLVY